MYNKTLAAGVTSQEVLDVMPGKKVALTIGDSTGDAKMAVSEEVKFDLTRANLH